jgi:hypothetical protein
MADCKNQKIEQFNKANANIFIDKIYSEINKKIKEGLSGSKLESDTFLLLEKEILNSFNSFDYSDLSTMTLNEVEEVQRNIQVDFYNALRFFKETSIKKYQNKEQFKKLQFNVANIEKQLNPVIQSKINSEIKLIKEVNKLDVTDTVTEFTTIGKTYSKKAIKYSKTTLNPIKIEYESGKHYVSGIVKNERIELTRHTNLFLDTDTKPTKIVTQSPYSDNPDQSSEPILSTVSRVNYSGLAKTKEDLLAAESQVTPEDLKDFAIPADTAKKTDLDTTLFNQATVLLQDLIGARLFFDPEKANPLSAGGVKGVVTYYNTESVEDRIKRLYLGIKAFVNKHNDDNPVESLPSDSTTVLVIDENNPPLENLLKVIHNNFTGLVNATFDRIVSINGKGEVHSDKSLTIKDNYSNEDNVEHHKFSSIGQLMLSNISTGESYLTFREIANIFGEAKNKAELLLNKNSELLRKEAFQQMEIDYEVAGLKPLTSIGDIEIFRQNIKSVLENNSLNLQETQFNLLKALYDKYFSLDVSNNSISMYRALLETGESEQLLIPMLIDFKTASNISYVAVKLTGSASASIVIEDKYKGQGYIKNLRERFANKLIGDLKFKNPRTSNKLNIDQLIEKNKEYYTNLLETLSSNKNTIWENFNKKDYDKCINQLATYVPGNRIEKLKNNPKLLRSYIIEIYGDENLDYREDSTNFEDKKHRSIFHLQYKIASLLLKRIQDQNTVIDSIKPFIEINKKNNNNRLVRLTKNGETYSNFIGIRLNDLLTNEDTSIIDVSKTSTVTRNVKDSNVPTSINFALALSFTQDLAVTKATNTKLSSLGLANSIFNSVLANNLFFTESDSYRYVSLIDGVLQKSTDKVKQNKDLDKDETALVNIDIFFYLKMAEALKKNTFEFILNPNTYADKPTNYVPTVKPNIEGLTSLVALREKNRTSQQKHFNSLARKLCYTYLSFDITSTSHIEAMLSYLEAIKDPRFKDLSDEAKVAKLQELHQEQNGSGFLNYLIQTSKSNLSIDEKQLLEKQMNDLKSEVFNEEDENSVNYFSSDLDHSDPDKYVNILYKINTILSGLEGKLDKNVMANYQDKIFWKAQAEKNSVYTVYKTKNSLNEDVSGIVIKPDLLLYMKTLNNADSYEQFHNINYATELEKSKDIFLKIGLPEFAKTLDDYRHLPNVKQLRTLLALSENESAMTYLEDFQDNQSVTDKRGNSQYITAYKTSVVVEKTGEIIPNKFFELFYLMHSMYGSQLRLGSSGSTFDREAKKVKWDIYNNISTLKKEFNSFLKDINLENEVIKNKLIQLNEISSLVDYTDTINSDSDLLSLYNEFMFTKILPTSINASFTDGVKRMVTETATGNERTIMNNSLGLKNEMLVIMVDPGNNKIPMKSNAGEIKTDQDIADGAQVGGVLARVVLQKALGGEHGQVVSGTSKFIQILADGFFGGRILDKSAIHFMTAESIEQTKLNEAGNHNFYEATKKMHSIPFLEKVVLNISLSKPIYRFSQDYKFIEYMDSISGVSFNNYFEMMVYLANGKTYSELEQEYKEKNNGSLEGFQPRITSIIPDKGDSEINKINGVYQNINRASNDIAEVIVNDVFPVIEQQFPGARDFYVSFMRYPSSAKAQQPGGITQERFYSATQEELNNSFFVTETTGLKLQTATEHESDEAVISVISQILQANFLEGHTSELANEVALGLAKLGDSNLKEWKTVLDPSKEEEGVEVFRAFCEDVIANQKSGSTARLIEAVNKYNDKHEDKISVNSLISHKSVFNGIFVQLASDFSKKGIRHKFTGNQMVMTPSHNVVKVYDFPAGSVLNGKVLEKDEVGTQEVYSKWIKENQGTPAYKTLKSRNLKWTGYYRDIDGNREYLTDTVVDEEGNIASFTNPLMEEVRKTKNDLENAIKVYEKLEAIIEKNKQLAKNSDSEVELQNSADYKLYKEAKAKLSFSNIMWRFATAKLQKHLSDEGYKTDPCEVIIDSMYKTQFNLEEGYTIDQYNENYFYIRFERDWKAKEIKKTGKKYLIDLDKQLKNLNTFKDKATETNRLLNNTIKSSKTLLKGLQTKINSIDIERLSLLETKSNTKNQTKLDEIEYQISIIDNQKFQLILQQQKEEKLLSTNQSFKQSDNTLIMVEEKIKNLSETYFTVPSKTQESLQQKAKEKYLAFQKSLEMVGARIPAQGMQSYVGMKVVGFQNDLGNAVYHPLEMLWFQGSDYDIDKLNIMAFAFDRGEFIKWNKDIDLSRPETFDLELDVDFIESDQFLPKRFRIKLSSTDEKGKLIEGDSIKVIKEKKLKANQYRQKAYKNYISQRLYDIITHPANGVQANSPISMDSMQAQSKKSVKGKLTFSQFSSMDQAIMVALNRDGKSLTGIFAQDMKAYAIYFNASMLAMKNADSRFVFVPKQTFVRTNMSDGAKLKDFTASAIKVTDKDGVPKFYSSASNLKLNESKQQKEYDKLLGKSNKTEQETKRLNQLGEQLKFMKEFMENASFHIDSAMFTSVKLILSEGGEDFEKISTDTLKGSFDELTKDMQDTFGNNKIKIREKLIAKGLKGEELEKAIEEEVSTLRAFYLSKTILDSSAWETISQAVSAATDNAKEMILGKLNLNSYTASTFSALTALGTPVEDIISILISPEADIIFKELAKSTDIHTYGNSDKIGDVVGRYATVPGLKIENDKYSITSYGKTKQVAADNSNDFLHTYSSLIKKLEEKTLADIEFDEYDNLFITKSGHSIKELIDLKVKSLLVFEHSSNIEGEKHKFTLNFKKNATTKSVLSVAEIDDIQNILRIAYRVNKPIKVKKLLEKFDGFKDTEEIETIDNSYILSILKKDSLKNIILYEKRLLSSTDYIPKSSRNTWEINFYKWLYRTQNLDSTALYKLKEFVGLIEVGMEFNMFGKMLGINQSHKGTFQDHFSFNNTIETFINESYEKFHKTKFGVPFIDYRNKEQMELLTNKEKEAASLEQRISMTENSFIDHITDNISPNELAKIKDILLNPRKNETEMEVISNGITKKYNPRIFNFYLFNKQPIDNPNNLSEITKSNENIAWYRQYHIEYSNLTKKAFPILYSLEVNQHFKNYFTQHSMIYDIMQNKSFVFRELTNLVENLQNFRGKNGKLPNLTDVEFSSILDHIYSVITEKYIEKKSNSKDNPIFVITGKETDDFQTDFNKQSLNSQTNREEFFNSFREHFFNPLKDFLRISSNNSNYLPFDKDGELDFKSPQERIDFFYKTVLNSLVPKEATNYLNKEVNILIQPLVAFADSEMNNDINPVTVNMKKAFELIQGLYFTVTKDSEGNELFTITEQDINKGKTVVDYTSQRSYNITDMFAWYSLITSKFGSSKSSFASILPEKYHIDFVKFIPTVEGTMEFNTMNIVLNYLSSSIPVKDDPKREVYREGKSSNFIKVQEEFYFANKDVPTYEKIKFIGNPLSLLDSQDLGGWVFITGKEGSEKQTAVSFKEDKIEGIKIQSIKFIKPNLNDLKEKIVNSLFNTTEEILLEQDIEKVSQLNKSQFNVIDPQIPLNTENLDTRTLNIFTRLQDYITNLFNITEEYKNTLLDQVTELRNQLNKPNNRQPLNKVEIKTIQNKYNLLNLLSQYNTIDSETNQKLFNFVMALSIINKASSNQVIEGFTFNKNILFDSTPVSSTIEFDEDSLEDIYDLYLNSDATSVIKDC